jgi:NAD(P)H-hydrate epimerase
VLCTLKGLPYKVEIPEAMLLPLPSSHGSFCKESLTALSPELQKFNAIVLGPGLGLSKETDEFLTAFFQLPKLPPLVIDADAITIISKLGLRTPKESVWTPHPGEAARILGYSPEVIQKDRLTAARSLAAKTGAVVVLKGAGTIIYANSTGSVVNRGNEYLATPGSGDVLAGIIATLIAQGFSLREAAERGVIIHGRAGEKAFAARRGPIIARDIIEYLQ